VVHTVSTSIIFDMVILLVAAFAGGSVARRFGYPAAIGELFVGVIIGPFAFGFVEFSGVLITFAEFGAIILLFYIGLETDTSMLRRYLFPSVLTGIVGAVVPLALGYYGGLLLGFTGAESLFVGTVLTATSIGITVRMLSDMGRLRTKVGTTILGAGVVDDVVGIALLSLTVSVLAGEFDLADLTLVLAKAAGFWLATIVIGIYFLTRALDKLRIRTESFTLLVLALGFAGAFASAELGLSSVIGAFAIGLALSHMIRAPEVLEKIQPIFLFFVPIFFISIGMLMDPRAFLSSVAIGLAVTLLAIAGKIFGCGIALLISRYSTREALTVGVGMIPRGEVGLIIAGIGLASGFIDAQTYLVAVMAVSLTTVIALPILRILTARAKPASSKNIGSLGDRQPVASHPS
jgi:Kef-type K+ transport system membrane component KefB